MVKSAHFVILKVLQTTLPSDINVILPANQVPGSQIIITPLLADPVTLNAGHVLDRQNTTVSPAQTTSFLTIQL